MRSLLARSKNQDVPASGQSPRRPDSLRRTTLATNSRMLLATAAVSMPLALYALLHGTVLPVLLALLGLATGAVGLVLDHRGTPEFVAPVQVYAVLLAGGVLALADPAMADFGLAVALMGPILAALLAGSRLRRQAWLLLGVVVVISLGRAVGLLGWPEHFGSSFRITGAVGFAITALVVVHTANRLNTAFEVYDRAQINAYRHLIEHVQDAAMRFSAEGDLVFTSLSSEKLLGCKRYELTGAGLIERLHVLDRPQYMTAFADANQGGVSRMIEVRMRHDGSRKAAPTYIWVEIALSPVMDGESAGRREVVALLRDVTDRRDQESEMRAARKAAEDASEAKTRFLANIGHELRTPLNAIIGFSEMMSADIGGELSPVHREYAELIHKSGTHLIGVVGMLLDMSRIEAGKFELHTDSFTPDTLVEPCFNMVGPLAVGKKVRLIADLPLKLPAIVGDERACRQILINLLSNAIKFSHEQGDVRVSMKRQGPYLNLSVADSGIGMSPEAMLRVGEPFFQAHEGLSRRYEGTGLGLSIVKGLVDLHQGELRVASEAGNGTTMTVLLPINGPEIKMPETSSVTPIRRDETAPKIVAPWPEQKRSAK